MMHSRAITSDRPKPARNAICAFAQDRHKRAARVLGFALVADSKTVWKQASQVLALRLTDAELAMIAVAALGAMETENAETLMCELLSPSGAGVPVVPLFGVMEQASFWADFATRDELKAYCLASYTRLPASDQEAFLRYVRGVQ